jgi:PTS system nitrogen regulatory IIA component
MKLADIIVTDAIIADLGSVSRDEATGQLVTALADAGAISKKSVKDATAAILAREKKGTTGIGKGVAVPHAKINSVKKVVGTIGRSSSGIDFNALDSKPVYIVILLLSPPNDPDEHLQAMETIFKYVQRDIFRRFLRQCETGQAIAELIEEADELA